MNNNWKEVRNRLDVSKMAASSTDSEFSVNVLPQQSKEPKKTSWFSLGRKLKDNPKQLRFEKSNVNGSVKKSLSRPAPSQHTFEPSSSRPKSVGRPLSSSRGVSVGNKSESHPLIAYDENAGRPLTKQGLEFINYVKEISPPIESLEEAHAVGLAPCYKDGDHENDSDPEGDANDDSAQQDHKSDNDLSSTEESIEEADHAASLTRKISQLTKDLTCLKLENLNVGTRVRDIRKVFTNCVSVTKPDAEFDEVNNEITRTCYVLFHSKDEASGALDKFQGVKIDGHKIRIGYRRHIK